MQTMTKYTFKLVQGITDEQLNMPTWHAIILAHTLTVDGEDRHVSNQKVVETFTRFGEDMAREDALRRTGELGLTA